MKSLSCSETEALIAKLCPTKITVAPTQGFFYLIDTLNYNLSNSGALLIGYQRKEALAIWYHTPKTSLLINIDFTNQLWLDPFHVFPQPVAREISYRTKGRALLLQNKTPVAGTQLALLDNYNAVFAHVWLIGSDNSADCNLFIFGKRGYDKHLKRFLKKLKYSLGSAKIESRQLASPLSKNSSSRALPDCGEPIYPQQVTAVVISKLLLRSLNQVRANIEWIDPHPDPEFLHDLRTAMRQAHAILSYFKSSLAQIGIETFQSELAYFLKQTSGPRNFEVFEMKLREMTDKVTGTPNFPRILKHCAEETELQYQRLTNDLHSARFEVFLSEWSRIAGRASSIALKLDHSQVSENSRPQSSLSKMTLLESSAIKQTFAEAMTELSWTQGNELNQQLEQLSKLKSVKKLHNIRKNFRNYKYLIEMVLYAWDKNKFSTSFPKIKKLVGWLGDLHDLYLEERLVQRLKCQDPRCQEEAAQLSALLNSQYERQFYQIRKWLKTFDRIDLAIDTKAISRPLRK
ncbi:MAG: CHAD domain-containing protein [Actinobacteria bacterium]|nr:CHAD domain-containing protein [Actinomycetota bacterium]